MVGVANKGELRHEGVDSFYGEHSQYADDPMSRAEGREVKLYSRDSADELFANVGRLHAGKANELIIGNAGGADEILSLYAVLTDTAQEGPDLVVVDRNRGNLANLAFRLATAFSHPETGGRWLALGDALGVPPTITRAVLRRSRDPLSDLEKVALSPKAAKKFLTPSALKRTKIDGHKIDLDVPTWYDDDEGWETQSAALEREYEKIAKKSNLPKEVWRHRVGDAFVYIPRKLAEQREDSVHGIVAAIRNSPKTHYLGSDDLYLHVAHAVSKTGSLIHWARLDLTKPGGLAEMRRIIETHKKASEGMLPVSIAFLPSLKKGFTATRDFLSKTVEDVIYRDEKPGESTGPLVMKDTDDFLPTGDRGAEEYHQALRNRPVLTLEAPAIEPPPGIEHKGLPRTLYVGSLNFGYKFSGDKEREQIIDVANKTGTKMIYVGDAVYGPHFFRQNKRRRTNDPAIPSLDAQLRAYKEFRGRVEANMTHIPGAEEEKVCEDLFQFYLSERARLEEDSATRGQMWDLREEHNSRHDAVQRDIHELLWPYLLRLGRDDTRMFTEEPDIRSPIIEILAALRRHAEGRPLRQRDLEVIVPEALQDTERFRVVPELISVHDGSSVRLHPRTMYSRDTQYVNPGVALKELSLQAQNGKNPAMDQEWQVDFGQPHMGFATIGEHGLLHVPYMDDDRRRFDPKHSSPYERQTVQDKGHKRVSIKRSLALPGGWFTRGHIAEWFYFEPMFPKVLRVMEDIQRTGIGIQRRTIVINHDNQLNSITERPDMAVRIWSYGFWDQKASIALNIGDRGQFRNYREMPNENAFLGGLTVGSMQRGIVELSRPFFELPWVDYWLELPGNHEWNTDRDAAGHDFLYPVEAAISQHVRERARAGEPHNLTYAFPEFVVSPKGDLMRTPAGSVQVGPYRFLCSHMYSQKGAGKGDSSRPATHLASWVRNMGPLAREFDIALGAHYHVIDILVEDDKLLGVLGATAGESGYEWARQYGGTPPYLSLMHIYEDGRIGMEIISENGAKQLPVNHPEIAGMGLDNFIMNAFTQPVHALGDVKEPHHMLYRRQLRFEPHHKV